MTVSFNSGIVQDGLTLNLDAANVKSYPGSGTVWYDLSENAITLNGSGTINYTTLGGAKCFGFNSSMYWLSSLADAQKTDYRYGTTIELWVYNQTKGSRKGIFEKNGTTRVSYEQEIAMTWETSDAISNYRNYNTYDSGSTTALTNNAWNHVVLVLYPHLSNGQWYLNGSANGSYYQNAKQLAPQAGPISIGNGYAGIMDTGGVAIVRTYSRMFDLEDVTQNFNACRKRFGL